MKIGVFMTIVPTNTFQSVSPNSDQTIDRRYLAIKVPNPLVPVDNKLAGRATKEDRDCAKALFLLCCIGCIFAFIDIFCCCCKEDNSNNRNNYY